MFNNVAADWTDANIDELRISDRALTVQEFLFAPLAGLLAVGDPSRGDTTTEDVLSAALESLTWLPSGIMSNNMTSAERIANWEDDEVQLFESELHSNVFSKQSNSIVSNSVSSKLEISNFDSGQHRR
jgi:hypothetical protein